MSQVEQTLVELQSEKNSLIESFRQTLSDAIICLLQGAENHILDDMERESIMSSLLDLRYYLHLLKNQKTQPK